MLKKLFSFFFCFLLVLTVLVTSCKTDVKIPEMVTISYVSEFGSLEKTEKVVEKGYILKNDDLPILTESGYTFENWFINKHEVSTGYAVNKDIVIVAHWTKIVDITAPKNVILGNIPAQNGKALVNWTIPKDMDEDFRGVEISMNPAIGTLVKPVILDRTATNFLIDNLIHGIKYTITIKTIDSSMNFSSGSSMSFTPEITSGDVKSPKEVILTDVVAENGNVLLNWDLPLDMDLDLLGIQLSMNPNEGTLENPIILEPSITKFNISGLQNNKEYFFTIKTFDKSFNFSAGVIKFVIPVEVKLDTQAPKDVENTNIIAENGNAVIRWNIPAEMDSDFYGIKLSMEPAEGPLTNPVILGTSVKSFNVSGITNGTEYTFKVQTFDKNMNFSEGISKKVTPRDVSDKTAPKEVTLGDVVAENGNAVISWTIPAKMDSDFYGIKLSMEPAEGTLTNPVILGTSVTSFNVSGLTNGKEYTFKVQTFDKNMNFSEGISKKVTPSDVSDKTAPKEVTLGDVVAENGNAVISWTIPAKMDSDFYGIKLSVEPAEGTLANPVMLNTSVESFNVSGLTNGTEYTFKVQTFDKNMNFSEGISKKVTPSDVSDKTAPKEVSNPKVENIDGGVVLSWTDPDDEDLFGIEINFASNISSLTRSISKMDSESIFVAPNTQKMEIPNLINDTEYIFTLKTMDLSGNKSKGNQVRFTPTIIEGKPLNIILSPSPDIKTKEDISVKVNVENARKIKTMKYAEGIQNVSYFATNGTGITNNTITVTENGKYTVFVQDVDGKREIKSFEITNIDREAPRPLIDFKASYSAANKEITLNWTNPNDTDYDGCEITTSDNKIVNVLKGENNYVLSNIEPDNETTYRFIARTKDDIGNVGPEVTCDVKLNGPIFSSFIIPDSDVSNKENKIIAEVKGERFESLGIDAKNIKLVCDNASILKESSIEIFDDETIKVTLSVPSEAGKYNVIISYGKISCNGEFTITNKPMPKIGDILLNDGKWVSNKDISEEQKKNAVAIIFKADNNGVLGIGLNQSQEYYSWATQDTFGHVNSFDNLKSEVPTDGYDYAITGEISGDKDGSDNWNEICNIDTNAVSNIKENYPAFDYANNYGKSLSNYKERWYIPSIAELIEIYKNIEIINESMKCAGASEIGEGQYWSSSQFPTEPAAAWMLQYSPGRPGQITDSYKDTQGTVICIHSF